MTTSALATALARGERYAEAVARDVEGAQPFGIIQRVVPHSGLILSTLRRSTQRQDRFIESSMYINFWYPVCTSANLGEAKPVHARLLGLNFVAFRDATGAAHVLSDTCAHRGGSLSKGTVRDDCVVCPYHGWRYRGDGNCQVIPRLAAGTKPSARASTGCL